MRRGTLIFAMAALLGLPAPSDAHDHGVPEGPWARVPKAGVSAAEVLRLPLGIRLETAREARPHVPAGAVRRLFPQLAAELGRGPDGGPAVAHRAGARPAPDAPGPLPRGVHVSTGLATHEPTIGIDSKGTLFFLNIGTVADELPISQVQRSRDEGRTWEVLDLNAPGVPDDTPTLDPLIYVDPATDRLFNFDLTLPCSAINISDDQGESFQIGSACTHTDHQTLFAGPPPAGGSQPSGYENIVYYCAIDGGASVAAVSTACSKSLDGGLTFLRTATPAFVGDGSRSGGSLGIEGFCYGATGHGRVGPDGTIYLPRGWCDQPFLAVSRDEGDSWERVQVSDLGMQVGVSAGVGIEEHEARVAIDPAGNVYYFWQARDRLPYLAISRDGGRTFGKPLMVAPPGVSEAWGPAIAAGANGRIAFTYMGTTEGPGPPHCVRTTPTGCVNADDSPGRTPADYENVRWSGYIGMSVDALADDPVFYSAPVNDPTDPFHRGYCGGIQCGAVHEFHDLVIGPDGTPWASFSDGCTADASQPCEGAGAGTGVAGRLVGGPPLLGAPPEQRPPVTTKPRPSRPCTPQRRVRVRIKAPKRGRIRSVSVRANGRKVRVRRRGERRVAVVDLRRFEAGSTVRVRVVTRTTAGRRYSSTRRFRICG